MNFNSEKITALLGPTNTGKTYLAIETMLEFKTGIFGFPLRLLAREVFDKCVQKIGPEKVALITGEEKIIPKDPHYYICTVESMPKNITVDFIGVDEIQMCSDHERGHIFTDRLLNSRGEKLTMFLGSQTMSNIISSLIKEVQFVNRDRYSKLSYSGHKKISRLNRKAAVIAFSIDEVYAIAELVRRQKGGAAIIMGSLSPTTRNAQVELYESGDVDFLIATDAIGMGINMDIESVYFSGLQKFDGKKNRRLTLSEIAQIAGRAGRHINDGYFGITGQCGSLTPEEIENLERHNLTTQQTIFWRNSKLDFESFETLIKSLELKSPNPIMKKINECEDEKVLKLLLKQKKELVLKNEKKFIQTLWECCQIPDFAKKAYGQHIEIVKKVYSFLTSGKSKVPNDYMKNQLKGLDNRLGNIDTLANRISNVRTWSYVANKRNWVENSDYWIERTKNIEDKLSEQLHEELKKSFIDKRIGVLSKSVGQNISLETEIQNDGKIIIDGQYIGVLRGLKIFLDFKSGSIDIDTRSLKKAALQAIAPELMMRVNNIIKDGSLILEKDLKIYWEHNPIAMITPGKDYLSPNLTLITDDAIEIKSKEKLKLHLKNWLDSQIKEDLNDLIKLRDESIESPKVRALCFQLYEQNGVMKRDQVRDLLKKFDIKEKSLLRKMGIKIGRYHVFLHRMLKPKAVILRINLWKNFFNDTKKYDPPKFGLNFIFDKKINNNKFLLICGFENFGDFYIRVDILERLFIQIIENTNKGKFKLLPEMLNLVGCNKENFQKLLKLMSYKHETNNKKEDFFIYFPKKNITKKYKGKKQFVPNSPFKILNNVNFK